MKYPEPRHKSRLTLSQATVDVWQWAVHHNPDHFALPDEFIPERWLDDPRFANDAKRALQPFSIGPRDCVGKK
jgi:cytochrome P450